MVIGRITARRRLRRAARESLAIPAFSPPVDCTPWVTGGLWPAELATVTTETAALAEYLKADLQRIAESANDVLKRIQRAGLVEPLRQEEETRVIEQARALAVQRVESTIRQVRSLTADARPRQSPQPAAGRFAGADMDTTQVIPAVSDDGSAEGRHRAAPDEDAERAAVAPPTEVIDAVGVAEPAGERLRRLLTFVARQAPRLNWAIGDRADGSTILVTDLAHGWIPPGITLPEGVRLLPPERRTGTAASLLGETMGAASYMPGDRLGWPDDYAPTTPSLAPREVTPIPEWERLLSDATRWRDGLPRMVHALAGAAGEGSRIVADEVDLLRVHLDTALHQLLIQHPGVDPALLLNCLLLAATEAAVSGDAVSASYHLAWFQTLNAPPES